MTSGTELMSTYGLLRGWVPIRETCALSRFLLAVATFLADRFPGCLPCFAMSSSRTYSVKDLRIDRPRTHILALLAPTPEMTILGLTVNRVVVDTASLCHRT